jgi:hypothetical protein
MSSCLASSYVPPSGNFLVTKEHRRFVEFCDACRRSRYIGLCHGVPGVGKTVSAYQYAQWDLLGSPASYYLPATAIPRTVVTERTIVYTPGVSAMPQQIERTVVGLRRRLNALAARAVRVQRGNQAARSSAGAAAFAGSSEGGVRPELAASQASVR